MTEFETALAGILADRMSSAEKAEHMQTLHERLVSASEALVSAAKECVDVFEEMEVAAKNAEINGEYVSLALPEEAYAVQEFVFGMKNVLAETLRLGGRILDTRGITWYYEGEPVEARINGEWVPAWHMRTEDGTATVCTEWLGGPRTDVPIDGIRRRQEQE